MHKNNYHDTNFAIVKHFKRREYWNKIEMLWFNFQAGVLFCHRLYHHYYNNPLLMRSKYVRCSRNIAINGPGSVSRKLWPECTSNHDWPLALMRWKTFFRSSFIYMICIIRIFWKLIFLFMQLLVYGFMLLNLKSATSQW